MGEGGEVLYLRPRAAEEGRLLVFEVEGVNIFSDSLFVTTIGRYVLYKRSR